jgi:cbb3-type cytochrome oxidase maturation protein
LIRNIFDPCFQKNKVMSALYLLIAASICVAVVFLVGFIWSVKNNQFSDQKGSSMRILFDDLHEKNK